MTHFIQATGSFDVVRLCRRRVSPDNAVAEGGPAMERREKKGQEEITHEILDLLNTPELTERLMRIKKEREAKDLMRGSDPHPVGTVEDRRKLMAELIQREGQSVVKPEAPGLVPVPDRWWSRTGKNFQRAKLKMPWKSTSSFTQYTRLIPADKRLSVGARTLASIMSLYDIHSQGKLVKHRRKKNLMVRTKREFGILYPSQETLARALGKSVTTVRKYIDELVHNGYLEVVPRVNMSNKYVMHVPYILSVEEAVEKFHVISCPLHASDFVFGVHTSLRLENEFRLFFSFVRSVKERNWADMKKYGRYVSYKPKTDRELEDEALSLYQKNGNLAELATEQGKKIGEV